VSVGCHEADSGPASPQRNQSRNSTAAAREWDTEIPRSSMMAMSESMRWCPGTWNVEESGPGAQWPRNGTSLAIQISIPTVSGTTRLSSSGHRVRSARAVPAATTMDVTGSR